MRNGRWIRAAAAALAMAMVPVSAARADDASKDERIGEIERQIAILAEEVEKLKAGETEAAADRGQYGLGPAASKVYRQKHGVSIGGYGEALYENYDGATDDQFDFLRAVVYLGYKFSDRWVLNSEIEFEHGSTGDDGEVSVEFAYLDFLWKPTMNVRAGLVLVPVGLVNELHEPTSFLGAKRPDVERALLPTTWRENGAGIFGDLGPLTYRTFVTTALDASDFSAAGIRDGRQNGSKAKAESWAWSGRLDYTERPGLLAGVSAYVGDSGQGLTTLSGESIGARTTILDLHADWRWRGLQVRAVGVLSRIDDVADLNAALGLAGSDSIGEEQEGYYVEAGYDVLSGLRTSRQSLVPFVRWESLDTQASVPDGFERDPANDRDVLTLGIAYRPIDPIVIKLDYQDYRNPAGTATDQFNVALGWIF